MSMIVRKVSEYKQPSRKRARSSAYRTSSKLSKSKGSSLGLYNSSLSRATRSGYKDFDVFASGVQEYGFGVNAAGFQYTNNVVTPTTQTWNGSANIPDLYDAYRILGFQITATFNQNVSAVTNGVVQTLPFMYVCKDYTDINTVSGSSAELMQKPDTIQICLGRTSSRSYDYKGFVVPKISQTAFSSGTTVGYIQPKAYQWISTTNHTGNYIDCPHFGIKFLIDASQMTAPGTFKIGTIRFYIKAFFEMKQST